MKIRWGKVRGLVRGSPSLRRDVCVDGLWFYCAVYRMMGDSGWRWHGNERGCRPHATMQEAMKRWRENYKIQLAEGMLEL